MFKYAFAVALLSSVALGFDSPLDRAWDEDSQSYCIDKCQNYCTNCTEPQRCDPETERKCGDKPINPTMSQCTPDELCVPIECECKHKNHY